MSRTIALGFALLSLLYSFNTLGDSVSDPNPLLAPTGPSYEQMMSGAAAWVSGLDRYAGGIKQMGDEARQEKEVELAQCLDDQKSRIDSIRSAANSNLAELQTASAVQGYDKASWAYKVIGVLFQNGARVYMDAQNCGQPPAGQ